MLDEDHGPRAYGVRWQSGAATPLFFNLESKAIDQLLPDREPPLPPKAAWRSASAALHTVRVRVAMRHFQSSHASEPEKKWIIRLSAHDPQSVITSRIKG